MTGSEAIDQRTTVLYRAVMPAERASIEREGRFTVIRGIETKYFATTEQGASTYAARAAWAFGDGPFTIYRTSIPSGLITETMRVLVDGVISTLVVQDEMLHCLSPPELLGFSP